MYAAAPAPRWLPDRAPAPAPAAARGNRGRRRGAAHRRPPTPGSLGRWPAPRKGQPSAHVGRRQGQDRLRGRNGVTDAAGLSVEPALGVGQPDQRRHVVRLEREDGPRLVGRGAVVEVRGEQVGQQQAVAGVGAGRGDEFVEHLMRLLRIAHELERPGQTVIRLRNAAGRPGQRLLVLAGRRLAFPGVAQDFRQGQPHRQAGQLVGREVAEEHPRLGLGLVRPARLAERSHQLTHGGAVVGPLGQEPPAHVRRLAEPPLRRQRRGDADPGRTRLPHAHRNLAVLRLRLLVLADELLQLPQRQADVKIVLVLVEKRLVDLLRLQVLPHQLDGTPPMPRAALRW